MWYLLGLGASSLKCGHHVQILSAENKMNGLKLQRRQRNVFCWLWHMTGLHCLNAKSLVLSIAENSLVTSVQNSGPTQSVIGDLVPACQTHILVKRQLQVLKGIYEVISISLDQCPLHIKMGI